MKLRSISIVAGLASGVVLGLVAPASAQMADSPRSVEILARYNEAMQAAISDDFLRALTAVGDADGVRAGVDRYLEAGATSPCVGPIPGTDFEATLRAAAP